ncbi:MAG: hypothetical protein KGZ88_07985 [Methylomicrobium sp.]|nr:hypothetical protein [Methylomicrobium sp.]
MQRCPCCNARLSGDSRCSRCGADLGRVVSCEQLAGEWLSNAWRMMCAKKPDIAAQAINRSLSFKQTQAAQVFRQFLVHHQYRALYEGLAQQNWQNARQTLAVLRALHGNNETLSRFQDLIDFLSVGDAEAVQDWQGRSSL